MVHVELNVGDKAWIHGVKKDGEMSEGKVVAKVQLDGYRFHHYIIAIPTPADELLEIRSPWSVSDDEHKPIGLWRDGRLSNTTS